MSNNVTSNNTSRTQVITNILNNSLWNPQNELVYMKFGTKNNLENDASIFISALEFIKTKKDGTTQSLFDNNGNVFPHTIVEFMQMLNNEGQDEFQHTYKQRQIEKVKQIFQNPNIAVDTVAPKILLLGYIDRKKENYGVVTQLEKVLSDDMDKVNIIEKREMDQEVVIKEMFAKQNMQEKYVEMYEPCVGYFREKALYIQFYNALGYLISQRIGAKLDTCEASIAGFLKPIDVFENKQYGTRLKDLQELIQYMDKGSKDVILKQLLLEDEGELAQAVKLQEKDEDLTELINKALGDDLK